MVTRRRQDVLRGIEQRLRVRYGLDETEHEDPFQSAASGRTALEGLPDGRLEVVPAGHVPWIDDHERTGELVAALV